MGRFYQTTAPEFVDDAMFKLPYEQMGAVLLAKDAKVGDDIEAATALGELLKAQGLKVDEPRLNQKIQEYEDGIFSTVDYIKGNVFYSRRLCRHNRSFHLLRLMPPSQKFKFFVV